MAANGPTGATARRGGDGATGSTGSGGSDRRDRRDGPTGATGRPEQRLQPARRTTDTDGTNATIPVTTSAVRFGTGTIKRKGRGVRVPILCNTVGTTLCVGTLEMRRGKIVLATAAYAIIPGQSIVRLVANRPVPANSKLRFTLRGLSPSGQVTRSEPDAPRQVVSACAGPGLAAGLEHVHVDQEGLRLHDVLLATAREARRGR